MDERKICSLNGSTFLVSNASGDFSADPVDATGFFFKDMRHLSNWQLLVDGKKPQLLSCDDVEYYFTQHFLAPATGTIYENPYVSVIRRRMIEDGFVETIELINHRPTPVEIQLSILFDADFSDIFEIKDALSKKGQLYQEPRDQAWILGYRREDFKRETSIECSQPCLFSEGRVDIKVSLAGKQSLLIDLKVRPVEATAEKKRQADLRSDFKRWLQTAPQLHTDADAVRRVYRKSMVDLAALRFFPSPEEHPESAVPAAGLPWFMSMFGRDSVIVSYQALPFHPDLAKTVLGVLASHQGTRVDDFRDEEPGKIMHELRYGELTYFKERPQSPYYGSADSTPLFLILLDEYERWTGDRDLVTNLRPNVMRALEWIDRYGDSDGDGFVEYKRKRDTGLENQCWKDSWNSILFSDGKVAEAPRATCEIQGYVYDAKIRTARLAREIWGDEELSRRLENEAKVLREKFHQAFWMEAKGHFALALDKDKKQVDSLTSNIGHLLWSGIVDDDKAKLVASHLMGPRLFSGWGIRTMAEGEVGYNPIEYHNGTVWPHDTAIIAAGLARYGYRAEASLLAVRIILAGAFFRFRLPEVFAGYAMSETELPVEYPTASSPQAWATGAPLLGLRVLLGLEPRENDLHSDPALPKEIGRLNLTGIPGRWGRKDVVAERENALSASDVLWQWFDDRGKNLTKRAA